MPPKFPGQEPQAPQQQQPDSIVEVNLPIHLNQEDQEALRMQRAVMKHLLNQGAAAEVKISLEKARKGELSEGVVPMGVMDALKKLSGITADMNKTA